MGVAGCAGRLGKDDGRRKAVKRDKIRLDFERLGMRGILKCSPKTVIDASS